MERRGRGHQSTAAAPPRPRGNEAPPQLLELQLQQRALGDNRAKASAFWPRVCGEIFVAPALADPDIGQKIPGNRSYSFFVKS